MTTFVLVHGAWHGGKSWDRVVPLLTSAGHRVLAPSLTGLGDKADLAGPEVGLDTHIADIVGLITEEDLHDVVLVGHSYGGMVISGAANEIPDRLSHLVYLDAMLPVDGENVIDIHPMTANFIELAARSEGGWRVPPLPESPQGLFGVTDPDDKAWVRSMLTDQPVRCFQQRVRLDNPAATAIPRTHIHCTTNRPPGIIGRPVPPIQPNGEPAQVWELPTGHDCMVTMPAELTELLLKVG